jgi:HEAT repeat protein
MIELVLLLPALLLAPHGGQYIPPAPDPGVPPPIEGVVAEPGLGPQLAFDATRWEWWFDFNQEGYLDLRNRLPLRARTAGASFEAPTADDRRKLVTLFVDALQDKPHVQVAAMRSNPRDVRAAAVVSLGRLQLADAVPYVELTLEGDPDLFVRTQALLALGFSTSPTAVETLVRIFRDESQSAELRTYAVTSLGLVSSSQAVDVLRSALGEKELAGLNNQLRDGVLYAAGVSGDTSLGDALRALSATHFYERQPDVRALTAFALGRLAEPASVAPLLKLVQDSDNQARRAAATALEGLRAPLDKAQVEILLARLKDESDAGTRHTLLRALGRSQSDVARAWLQEALGNSRTDDRPHVALALAIDGHFSNAAPLLAALKDEHEASQEGALALALGLLAAPDAVEPLAARFAEAKDPLLLANLLLALGLLDPGDPAIAQRAEDLARSSSDVEVVRCAVISLGLLGERDRLSRLAAEAAKVPAVVHRAALVFALGLAGDRGFLAPLSAIATDSNQPIYVRAYALQALGELADPRPMSPVARLSGHVDLSLDVGFLFELYRAF